MAGEMKYRLKAGALSSAHMNRYAAAVEQAKSINDNRGYYHFSGLHGAPGRWCWHHQFSSRSNLTARLFLPWHRAYLHRYEQALQDIDPNVALPWWDWTIDKGLPTGFTETMFGDRSNPLLNARIRLNPPQVPNPIDEITTRSPDRELPWFTRPEADADGNGRTTLSEFIEYLFDSVTQFETFNDLLESVHDALHGYVGGHMGIVSFSAYDPIFYSHHCMIDRVWAVWQQRHGTNNFPSALKSIVLEPFGLTAGEVLNTQELGYEYASTLSLLDINTSNLLG